MHEEDEEFLGRVRKEEDEGRLDLKKNVDASGFDKIMKRLIEEPPAPKAKEGEAWHHQIPKETKITVKPIPRSAAPNIKPAQRHH
jgi:hypothetical protein